MAKPKRKETLAQRRAKHERTRKYMTICVNGKPKRRGDSLQMELFNIDE